MDLRATNHLKTRTAYPKTRKPVPENPSTRSLPNPKTRDRYPKT